MVLANILLATAARAFVHKSNSNTTLCSKCLVFLRPFSMNWVSVHWERFPPPKKKQKKKADHWKRFPKTHTLSSLRKVSKNKNSQLIENDSFLNDNSQFTEKGFKKPSQLTENDSFLNNSSQFTEKGFKKPSQLIEKDSFFKQQLSVHWERLKKN